MTANFSAPSRVRRATPNDRITSAPTTLSLIAASPSGSPGFVSAPRGPISTVEGWLAAARPDRIRRLLWAVTHTAQG